MTGIGFQPIAVVLGNTSQIALDTDQELDMEHGFSAFSPTVSGSLSINSENGTGTSDCNSNSYSEAYARMDTAGTSTVSRATFVSMNVDGFTLNHSVVDGGAARKSWGLAFGPEPTTVPTFMMVT